MQACRRDLVAMLSAPPSALSCPFSMLLSLPPALGFSVLSDLLVSFFICLMSATRYLCCFNLASGLGYGVFFYSFLWK